MCDTMVSITKDGVLFAKNSDRDANESQILEWHAGTTHDRQERLRCTWIEIPQVASTHAVLISRPWWMWGAEIGANDKGVVIGNEAVFTNEPYEGPALLGMDLLRLGLERSATAPEAAGVVVDLLERYGQGGPCSYEHPKFTYHNSFLIADTSGAILLETAGRRWATKEISAGSLAISNCLTIDGFAERHGEVVRARAASCAPRKARTSASASKATHPVELMAGLRDHGDRASPRWSAINGAMSAPCVHAGGLVVSSQTTASWISDLRAPVLHWATGSSAPCTSLFKPVRVDDPVDLGPSPTNHFDPRTLWWRHEQLHRATMADHAGLLARYRPARDRTEAEWLSTRPSSSEAFAMADLLERQWLADVIAAGAHDRRPGWLQRHWRALDRAAGIDLKIAA